MKIVLPLLLLVTCFSNRIMAVESGSYLDWDTDHTERKIRPVYPVLSSDKTQFNTYHITAKNSLPQRVCFFALGEPSDHGEFGAHCMKFNYLNDAISRTFFNVKGEQVSNKSGIYTIHYTLEGQKFPVKKQNFDISKQLINDKTGTATYVFKRDELGRRNSEIRFSSDGKVVPEHNGFYEARFDFDDNDYATYRRGYDQHGNIMEGDKGYATAHFWFDQNGNFEEEEFRDAKGKLVMGPSGRYARIKYNQIDEFGHWHEANLYDTQGKLIVNSPAILKAQYDDNALRKSIRYFDTNHQASENTQGIHHYKYQYKNGVFTKRKGYSISGEEIK